MAAGQGCISRRTDRIPTGRQHTLLDNEELKEALKITEEIAIKAWDIIEPLYQTDLRIYEKPGDGPATEADIKADHFIIEELQSKFGDHFGYFSEENYQGAERFSKKACWIVDPIDGTRDFMEGKDDFAIQIGLAQYSEESKVFEPDLGVVYMPRYGFLFSASRGTGAWERNMKSGGSRQCYVSEQENLEKASAVVSSSGMGRRISAALERLSPAELQRRGSLGVKVMEVVAGRADFYINTSRGYAKEWDICAPHAILREAKGTMRDLSGNRHSYLKENYYVENGIIAGNKALCDQIILNLQSESILWE